jgi:hypothetical protein
MVSQGFSDPRDVKLRSAFEVARRLARPKGIAYFIARYQVIGMGNQQLQKVKRVRSKINPHTITAQFVVPRIKLEDNEPNMQAQCKMTRDAPACSDVVISFSGSELLLVSDGSPAFRLFVSACDVEFPGHADMQETGQDQDLSTLFGVSSPDYIKVVSDIYDLADDDKEDKPASLGKGSSPLWKRQIPLTGWRQPAKGALHMSKTTPSPPSDSLTLGPGLTGQNPNCTDLILTENADDDSETFAACSWAVRVMSPGCVVLYEPNMQAQCKITRDEPECSDVVISFTGSDIFFVSDGQPEFGFFVNACNTQFPNPPYIEEDGTDQDISDVFGFPKKSGYVKVNSDISDADDYASSRLRPKQGALPPRPDGPTTQVLQPSKAAAPTPAPAKSEKSAPQLALAAAGVVLPSYRDFLEFLQM